MNEVYIDKNIDSWLFELEKSACYGKVFCLKNKYVQVKTNDLSSFNWLKRSLNHYFVESEDIGYNIIRIIAIYVSNLSLEKNIAEESIDMYLYTIGSKLKEDLSKADLYYNHTNNYLHTVYNDTNILVIDKKIKDNIRIPFRLLRETLISTDKTSSFYRFHAASIVDAKNNAWLIIGKKGAGKTSFLLSALCGKLNFCSNDRTVVYMTENGEMSILGVPTSIRLSDGQLKKISSMMQKDKMVTVDYCDIGVKGGKKEFSAEELTEYFGVEIRNNCLLRGVIVVEFSNKSIESYQITDYNQKNKYLQDSYMERDIAFPNYFQEMCINKNKKQLFVKLMQLPWFFVSGYFYECHKFEYIFEK